ncbi:pyridine nucleotide-disulfide oxidoreductase domain-containing protein 1-like [Styela clava]
MSCEMSPYVVIGGGIAGVSCAQSLKVISSNKQTKVVLLSSSSVVKSVTNINRITQNIEDFDVTETKITELNDSSLGIEAKCCDVVKINPEKQVVITSTGEEIFYSKLCVCTGAKPSLINNQCPHVIGIRDTQTVNELESLVAKSKKIVVVGNGGIAMELVYSLENIDVVWVIKDTSIGKTFFDGGAAEFLLSSLDQPKDRSDTLVEPDKRRSKYTVFNLSNNSSTSAPVLGGSALGPDWHQQTSLTGSSSKNITFEYGCTVQEILYGGSLVGSDGQFPVEVILSNGKHIECDFVVSATGVSPNIHLFNNMPSCTINLDGGVEVDSNMRVTGVKNIYAAGDVCSCSWQKSPHWLQMRLWTQARQMGIFAAHCMVSHSETGTDPILDFCFEVFTHVTKFFGYKIVLLGKYNCQNLDLDKTQLVVRVTPGLEYIKVVLFEGRMYGAVLVGETDLEETFENLILNGMDLSHYGENLLHPNVDLDDYFD